MITFRGQKYKKRSRFIRRNPKIYMSTPRIKARREIPTKKIFIFTLLVIFVGTIFWFAFMSGYFRVKNLIITGNQNIKQKDIEEALNSILYSNILSNNILFFKTGSTGQKILDQFKEIKNIEVTKKLPSTLKIKIDERNPSIILQSGDKKYLIDADGSVFSEYNQQDQKYSGLPLVNDLTKPQVKDNQKVLSISFVSFIQQLVNKLPQKAGLTVDTIIIHETLYEIEVKTKEGPTVYFDTSRNIDIQLSYLVKVLEEIKKNGVVLKNVDYIDLRLPDKLFYKYK